MRCILTLVTLGGIAAAAPDPVPMPEVVPATVKLDLPAIPSFELPEAAAGVHGAKELRVNGTPLLGTDVKVTGYVVWIYDCVAANLKTGLTRAQVQKQVDDDPTLCERMKFYLADRPDAPPDTALWVVDVPRPPNKLESTRLPKADLAKWPAVPKYAVGDYVTVTGNFTLTSPHNERNSDGLLVYKALERTTPSKTPPRMVPLAEPPAKDLKAPAATPRKQVTAKVQNESAEHLNRANKLVGDRKLDEALAEYQAAIAAWPGNHLAYYGMGTAYVPKGDWVKAADAFAQAATMRPDAPAYLMWAGIAAYEVATDEAKGGAPNYDKAEAWLVPAVAASPGMWRAHHYLGKIYRSRRQVKAAANEFTKAIETNPREQAPYVALAELYRKWDYADQAIRVAEQGAKDTNDPDVWVELGLAYEARNPDKAIEAYTKALDAKPTAIARFSRAKLYFQKKDYAKAKPELEAYVKMGDKDAFRVALANQFLSQLPKTK